MGASRLAIGVPIAGIITFSLFVLMMTLVTGNFTEPEEEVANISIDLTRIKRDEEVQTKTRAERPEKTETPPPPPPSNITPQRRDARFDTGGLDANVDIDFQGLDVAAPTDGDAIPLVRVAPIYPERAASRGTEGWVVVQFNVLKSGQVDPKSVIVVESQPPGVFDRAAINAVKRWKYKPKVVNGQPVERVGIQTQLTFELQN